DVAEGYVLRTKMYDSALAAQKALNRQAIAACDNAISAAPHLAFPYLLKIKLLLWEARGDMKQAELTRTMADAEKDVTGFRQTLKNYKGIDWSQLSAKIFATKHRL